MPNKVGVLMMMLCHLKSTPLSTFVKVFLLLLILLLSGQEEGAHVKSTVYYHQAFDGS